MNCVKCIDYQPVHVYTAKSSGGIIVSGLAQFFQRPQNASETYDR